jgi:hypothetical protein
MVLEAKRSLLRKTFGSDGSAATTFTGAAANVK